MSGVRWLGAASFVRGWTGPVGPPHWWLELPNPDHGRHQLCCEVRGKGLIEPTCRACALRAQAVEALAQEELRLVYDASGHESLVPCVEDGYKMLIGRPFVVACGKLDPNCP